MLKKILWLLVLIALGIYGTPAFTLSESGANRFLDKLESLSLQGHANEYCARLHEDLKASVKDHTAPDLPREFTGGKAQFCDYVSNAAKGMSLLGISTNVTRNHFTVERSWLHPWTARVSYEEERTTTMAKLNVTVNSRSKDRLTLVQTLRGVKLVGLDSEAWRVEESPVSAARAGVAQAP
jgi:hypothetical protein